MATFYSDDLSASGSAPATEAMLNSSGPGMSGNLMGVSAEVPSQGPPPTAGVDSAKASVAMQPVANFLSGPIGGGKSIFGMIMPLDTTTKTGGKLYNDKGMVVG